jgi:hypothetical protein
VRRALAAAGVTLGIVVAALLGLRSGSRAPATVDRPLPVDVVAAVESREGGTWLEVTSLWPRAVDETSRESEELRLEARLAPYDANRLVDVAHAWAGGSSRERARLAPGSSDGSFSLLVSLPAFARDVPRGIVLEVGDVSRWRTERFELAGPGDRGPFRCGPFVVVAECDRARVRVAARSDGGPDERTYRARVPLGGLTHAWIRSGGLALTDATGAELASDGGAGGASFTSIAFPRLEASDDGASAEPLRYPLTVRVRIPDEVRMRTLTFDLDEARRHPRR